MKKHMADSSLDESELGEEKNWKIAVGQDEERLLFSSLMADG